MANSMDPLNRLQSEILDLAEMGPGVNPANLAHAIDCLVKARIAEALEPQFNGLQNARCPSQSIINVNGLRMIYGCILDAGHKEPHNFGVPIEPAG